MVKLILTLLLIIPFSLSAQKEYTLKSRFLGQYKGEISSYNIDTGKKIMKVSSSAIYIELEKEKITITIGNNQLTGTYAVMFKAKKYYLIDARIEDQLATERIIVYTRGRKLSRDGMYPQPVTELLKY